jgi:hypothetical protein
MKLKLVITLREDGTWHHLSRYLKWPCAPQPGDEILINGMGFTVEALTHCAPQGHVVVHLADANCGKEAVRQSLEHSIPPEPMDLAWWREYCRKADFEESKPRRKS